LSYGPIPIYYGAPDLRNITDGITKKPSYIDISEYSSPAALGKYLQFLVDNPTEYNKYHEWRLNPKIAFTEKYLRLVSEQVPSPGEMFMHSSVLGTNAFASRRAKCCRLCDLAY